MTQATLGATAPVLIHPQTQTLAHHNIAQYRAIKFVSDRIAEADASQWHGGYIHGLIQALTMTSTITVEQASKLEQAQEQASCKTFNRRAAGGAA
jgi:hypothetical protein